MCFVMAKLGCKFKPRNKNREAVPNVVIVKPSIDDEQPTNKTLYKQGMLLFGSHIVTSRKCGKVTVYKSYCYVFLYQDKLFRYLM